MSSGWLAEEWMEGVDGGVRFEFLFLPQVLGFGFGLKHQVRRTDPPKPTPLDPCFSLLFHDDARRHSDRVDNGNSQSNIQ